MDHPQQGETAEWLRHLPSETGYGLLDPQVRAQMCGHAMPQIHQQGCLLDNACNPADAG